MLSRQFLGITRLVRRGLVALVVWTLLLALYSSAFDVLNRQLGLGEAFRSTGLSLLVIGIAFVAGTFPVIQRLLRQRLESILFRDAYDYARTLRDLGFETARLTSAEAISNHVLARLGDTLDLCWAALVLRDASSSAVFHWGDCPLDVIDELGRLQWGTGSQK